MDDDELNREEAIGGPTPRKLRTRRPGETTRCGACGSANLALLPMFATGIGTGFRTLVDDVYCLRCGYMGQPGFAGDVFPSPQQG